MRELKFRAWDKLEKRMRKVVSLHWQGDKLVSAKLEGDRPRRWYAHMERKIVVWASMEECKKSEAVARLKDISDNLGNIVEYEEPEDSLGPKPPNIPDFNWDVKLGP